MPTVNASLNGLSAVLLLCGYAAIRRRRTDVHKRFMLAACGSSSLFLACYLTYHAFAGTTRFAGTGWSRPVYFGILLSHTVLAVVILPMAIVTVTLGLRKRFERHRRIARWTFPLWLYVSVTGVLVYLFLYHLFPSA